MESIPRRLFEHYHLRVYRYFLGYVRQAVAEELSQEVFLKVVKGVEGYEQKGRDAAWVFTIARRVLLDFWRQQGREQVVGAEHRAETEPRTQPRQLVKITVREALSELPDAQRDAFLLREIGGLSYAEIATVRDTTTIAVRSLLHRARQTLRAELSGEPRDHWDRKNVKTFRR